MSKCLLFLLFLMPIHFGKEIDKAMKLEGNDRQISQLKRILSQAKAYKDTTALIHFRLGFRYEKKIDSSLEFIDSALYFYNLSIATFSKNDNQNKAGKNYLNLSYCYKKKNEAYKAALNLMKATNYATQFELSDFCKVFSEILLLSNNNKLNIDVLKFQLYLQNQEKKEDPLKHYNALIKLSKLDTFNHNPIALQYLYDALNLTESNQECSAKRIGCLNELGIRYKEYGFYKNSEHYYKMMNDGSPEFKSKLGLYHNNLGELYTKMKKLKLAEYHRIKAYEILTQDKDTPPNDVALNLVGKSEMKENMRDYNSALSFIDEALKIYPFDKNNLDKIDHLEQILERKYYRYYLQKKISKDYFNINELNEIDFITDALRKQQTDEASKQDTRKSAIVFYKEAAFDCITHENEKLALYFKEKAKSILLVENYLQLTNEKEILDFKYAVDDLLKSEKKDSISITKVFAKLKPILELIVKKYETNAGLDNEVFSDAIEKSLAANKPDHAYLDFFETENDMLVFKITNKINVYHLKLNPELIHIIKDYNEAVLNKGDLCLAPLIYDALIKPLGQLPKNLTIIPDSYLSYLSFEALHSGSHSDAKDYTSYDFLIKKHNISYNYSLGMASLMHDKKCTSQGKHVFLPTFTFPISNKEKSFATERQLLIPLRYASEEADEINKLFKTKFYKGISANKNNFVSSLKSANLIHFAGHAIINHEDHHLSYLAFNSEEKDESRLYLKDISGVASNADLIVLSACQTATGKYSTGEGLLSLGRAMVSCGSKSVVTSLWNVNDFSGQPIISSFYKNLKAGKDKSSSLYEAKLNFLNTLKSNQLGHPYYWSAFIFMGDDSPLQKDKSIYSLCIYISLIFAAAALTIFLYKKYK
jgi:CHAT domain-containing protein